MKILVAIPFLYGYGHSKNAIESVMNQKDVDLLFIDNGGDPDIKTLAAEYLNHPNVKFIRNAQNIFVNPAWNQAMKLFLTSNYDLLCIMNSDLCLQQDWSEVVRKRLRANQNECMVPKVVTDINVFNKSVDVTDSGFTEANIGLPGIFFTLTKKQCQLVYPIPSELKIWFGDNWVFDRLRNSGHKTIIPEGFIAIHGNSQTVSKLPGISELIEIDKLEWKKLCDSGQL